MGTELQNALARVGWSDLSLPSLDAAFAHSESCIETARAHLAKQLDDADPAIDVVAFGSLARREMTPASDLDWLVVVHALPERRSSVQDAVTAADSLRMVIGDGAVEVRAPGSSGVFGQMVSAVELVEVIGLQADTNHSHTRRILLIEESVSLRDEELHRKLLTTAFQRYLDAHPPATTGVPRFLLNDLLRYWRTVTVDYQAKSPAESMYSLRYLKLIVSRKLTFAASLLPLLTLALEEPELPGDAFAERLCETYSKPALVRWVDAAAVIVARNDAIADHVKDVLRIAEEFNGLVGDSDWRLRVAEASRQPDAKDQPEFSQARDLGRRLQDNLEAIFFAEPLLPLTRGMLVF
ncbi:nucleotidyltransferase domain-containing protein [Microbacterium sp. PMB16]|uniref:nucleotidyltransferase domain-containing protein n=1 Tax=Microbacterium sp. PMB16 TaxID=3120157 RepID=UPI003F4C71E0